MGVAVYCMMGDNVPSTITWSSGVSAGRTRPELDMALLGQLSAFTFTSEVTVRRPSHSRQKSYTISVFSTGNI